jgi:serine/threonine protein phosphatase PrpC
MSEDHKPNNEVEFARITKAGGSVQEGRINGSINLSRSLGDFNFKNNREIPLDE